jgi:hypothetical protein
MPLFSAVQTPTELSSGDKLSVLNGENLALNALTMAVSLTPQPAPIDLAIVNGSSQTVSLVASADNKSDGSTYFPVYNEAGNAVTAATDTVATVRVAPGLYYAIKAGAAITAGTIWLAR